MFAELLRGSSNLKEKRSNLVQHKENQSKNEDQLKHASGFFYNYKTKVEVQQQKFAPGITFLHVRPDCQALNPTSSCSRVPEAKRARRGLFLTLSAQIKISLRVNLHEIVIHKVVDEVNGLARGFHFRTKLLVHVRELVETEYRFLNSVS